MYFAVVLPMNRLLTYFKRGEAEKRSRSPKTSNSSSRSGMPSRPVPSPEPGSPALPRLFAPGVFQLSRPSLAVWSLLSLVLCLIAAPASAAERPNVVLIISDDHAWTDCGFMGHPHIQTPNLDRLAAESLCFRRGYVSSSLCCPSLATIITGMYPHQHKVTSNDPPIPAGMTNRDFQKSDAFRDGREAMNRHGCGPDAPEAGPRRGLPLPPPPCRPASGGSGNFRRGGFTDGMTTGQRYGDAGLDIGRKTMQPVDDFIRDARPRRLRFSCGTPP